MNTETQNESSSSFNRDIKTAIEEIASDLNMKDYSISKKNVPFTGDNYCGNISNVKLKSQNDEDLNVDLFVKEAQREVSRLGSVHKLYEAEIFSYTDILPAFRMLEEVNNILERDRIIYAKYYKGNKKNFKEFVILNDLTCEGYLMYNKRKPFDFEHISLAVQNLAKIHSHSFVLKDKDPELFTYLKSNVTKDFLYEDYIMPTFEAIGKNAVRSIQDQDNKTILEDIINNGADILRTCLDSSLSEPFNVICHGDCWTNNMLFKYEDAKVCSTVLIDWQIVRYASPVTDLLTVICSTMDKTMLESHFYGLLDIYHEAMRLHMEKMDCDIDKHFPKAVLMEGVKSMLRYGLNLATIVISVGSNDSEQVIRLEEYQENSQMAPISSIASKRINDLLDFFKATDLI